MVASVVLATIFFCPRKMPTVLLASRAKKHAGCFFLRVQCTKCGYDIRFCKAGCGSRIVAAPALEYPNKLNRLFSMLVLWLMALLNDN